MTEDEGHEHEWKGRLFSDGCHFFSNVYECKCGAVMSVTGERIFVRRGQPQPGLYMMNPRCPRCLELEGGARRKATKRLFQPAPGRP